MSWVILLLQFAFVLLMIGLLVLFLFSLLLTWTWAQNQEKTVNFSEILSTAAIEWGACVVLAFAQFRSLRAFHEAPPLIGKDERLKRQFPVVFVPSLHSGSGVFSTLLWRLKRHFYTSLWPFSWKSFLRSEVLLEDELANFLEYLLRDTQSPKFRVISFGTSRPVVSRVLSKPRFSDMCDKWIAVSAPKTISPTLKFISSHRIREVYDSSLRQTRNPDLLFRGTHDTICYPESVWGEQRTVLISPLGHYSSLLHSTTVQRILDELS